LDLGARKNNIAIGILIYSIFFSYNKRWAQNTVQNSVNGPWTWSLSYGWPEEWQCLDIDGATVAQCPVGYDYKQYINATNVELQKLGTIGVTVLVSSGDDGTPGKIRSPHPQH
jgi:subtilase family serine protease